MKKLAEAALGIVTSIGGFLEVGSIATSVQAGAEYRFQLVWIIVLGTLCLIALVEMSGRLAAVSHHTIAGALRERFGFNVYCLVLLAVGVASLLVLAAELGGVSLAIQLATGVAFPWWALPVGLLVWLVLWKGTFGVIEYGASFLGLITVVFLVAAVKLHPAAGELAAGILPSLPRHDGARYWFIAVNILGATLTPYIFYFYSSGAVEDGWTARDLGLNRVVATTGMAFGGGLSVAVLAVAAMVFEPRGIQVERYEQLGVLLSPVLGHWGFWLFTGALGIACLGAALEVTLAVAYLIAQGFGWNWGEDLEPREAARFSTVYTLTVIFAVVVTAVGTDPLTLTIVSMTLTSAILPLAIFPFLLLMNDRHYVGAHRNGWLSNSVVVLVIGMAFVLAITSLPLQILGG